MILKKNIEVLKQNKYNINVIKKIESINNNDNYEIKFNKNNLISVSYKNKALTSLYAPIEEAKRLIEQYIKNNDADYMAIFLSIASFYHIDYFLSLNDKNKAIIIEKDIELLKLILSNIEIKNYDKIIILSEENDISLFFNNFIREDNVKKLVVIRHIRASNVSEENKSYYDNITIQLSNIIKERLMSLTSNYYFAPIWARNIIYNMHNNNSIESFKNYLNKETPLLLVSAGASIDNYIEKIKELSESHFVLAVSHSLNTLLNNNIKPNAVVSTDGGFYSLTHILSLFKEESILLFTTHTSYPVNSIKKERKFFFSHNESLEKILYGTQDNIYFPMEGSVIMPALRIAEFLNPKYILLAGCDFCHVDDKSHSKYSNAIALDFITSSKINKKKKKKYKRLNDDNKIKCFDDCLRNTSSSLLSYKTHFESLVADLSKNIDFFTLTKESAKIKNVNIYDEIKNSDKQLKDYKDFKYIEEKQNKELLKNKLESLIKNINSNNFNNANNNFFDDIDEILNMISPWHRDAFIEGKIKYDELKYYINKWYNDVYDLID